MDPGFYFHKFFSFFFFWGKTTIKITVLLSLILHSYCSAEFSPTIASPHFPSYSLFPFSPSVLCTLSIISYYPLILCFFSAFSSSFTCCVSHSSSFHINSFYPLCLDQTHLQKISCFFFVVYMLLHLCHFYPPFYLLFKANHIIDLGLEIHILIAMGCH